MTYSIAVFNVRIWRVAMGKRSTHVLEVMQGKRGS